MGPPSSAGAFFAAFFAGAFFAAFLAVVFFAGGAFLAGGAFFAGARITGSGCSSGGAGASPPPRALDVSDPGYLESLVNGSLGDPDRAADHVLGGLPWVSDGVLE